MPTKGKYSRLSLTLWVALGLALLGVYEALLRKLWGIWLTNDEFSYGILVPLIVVYLLWLRRGRFRAEEDAYWVTALGIAFIGCGLHVVGSLSGTLFLSGLGFAGTLLGVVGFLWGRTVFRVAAPAISLSILMVPLPSYLIGQLTWYLQVMASTISSTILALLGIPVFQDGNLLKLSNYVLEVKQACSGSRSIFALLALALVLGIGGQRKVVVRILLVATAPALAVGANVIRIVGTGVIAQFWGGIAANESLHTVWGIFVFAIAVAGLLSIQRMLKWATNEYA
jgi:exosortase